MFDASAPPRRVVCTPVARPSVPEIWNIQVSVEPPEIVKPVAALTELDHWYSPGNKVCPPMLPLTRFTKLGFTLPLASVKAVCMSEMAVMSCEGVGDVYDAANSSPVTCVDVEKVPVGSNVRENPVKPVEETGLTPMFPVIEEAGTVDTPDSARMAKLPAVRRLTAAGPVARALLVIANRPRASAVMLMLDSMFLFCLKFLEEVVKETRN
jgi:hypothetical protein